MSMFRDMASTLYIMLLAYSISSGVLVRHDLLPSYIQFSIAFHNTVILIITLTSFMASFDQLKLIAPSEEERTDGIRMARYVRPLVFIINTQYRYRYR